MTIYPNIYLAFFYSIIIVSFNFYLFKKISKYLTINLNIMKIIFFNHLIFAIIFFCNDFFSLFNFTPGSDSLSFYFNSDQKILYEDIPFYPGHNFLYYLVFYLKKFFFFDFLSLNLLFSLFGSLSVLIFYGSASKYLINKLDSYIFLIFVLLPSYNFWTSGISKDVITAFALSLILLSFIKNNFKFLLVSIVLLFFVRVHLALLVILSFLFSVSFLSAFALISKKNISFNNINLNKKIILIYSLSILILSIFIIKEFFLNHVLDLQETIRHFQIKYTGDNFIESFFFPLRVLEYLIRPYLWEENIFLIKILSLENILILLIFIFFLIGAIVKFKKTIKFESYDLKIFILFSFILIFIFQITLTSNVGIAMRQKWTFLPGLIFIFIYLKFYFVSNEFNKINKK